MNWIQDHFQIVVLLGLALASLVKRRMDAKAAGQPPPDPAEMTDPEEIWQIPPRRAAPNIPPPLARQDSSTSAQPLPYQNASKLKRQQVPPAQPSQVKANRVTTTGGAVATSSRVSATQRHPKAVAHATSGLRDSLHQRKQLRRAIVLREILGPPVGLR